MNCLSPQNVAPPFIVLTESVNALGLYVTAVGLLRSTDWFDRDGPDIAASDYTRAFADQIRPYTDKTFYAFGTDGYGRSDTRKNLRKFFEVDKEHIVAFTLSALAKEQLIASKDAEKAIKKFKINKNRDFPANL